jgi:phospholipase C
VAARCCLLLVALAALLLAPSPAAGAARDSHVVLIVLENREYDQVIGGADAPYLNHLARRGALATDYHGVTHPSLPNYLALLGGSTFGIDENCTDCSAAGDNLAAQLSRAGVSWRAYMGGMPRACFGGAEHGTYVKRHNPFMYFPSVAAAPSRCARVVPEERLDADLRRRALPELAWLTLDLCEGAHDCGIAAADGHLAALVPRITRQLGPRGLLIVTFDEGTSDAGCCGGSDGGRIATILVGPRLRPGARINRPADHYSLLAALEDRFGVPRLRHARGVRPLF